MTYIKIPQTTLMRDMKSRALVETDVSKKEEYKARSATLNSQKKVQEEINTIKEKMSKIDRIESDMEEIKNLLKGLIK